MAVSIVRRLFLLLLLVAFNGSATSRASQPVAPDLNLGPITTAIQVEASPFNSAGSDSKLNISPSQSLSMPDFNPAKPDAFADFHLAFTPIRTKEDTTKIPQANLK